MSSSYLPKIRVEVRVDSSPNFSLEVCVRRVTLFVLFSKHVRANNPNVYSEAVVGLSQRPLSKHRKITNLSGFAERDDATDPEPDFQQTLPGLILAF